VGLWRTLTMLCSMSLMADCSLRHQLVLRHQPSR